MKQKRITVAIDGHSSCGKSTMAKALAKRVGYAYIDTGAMYRAVTLYCLEHDMIKGDEVNKPRLRRHICENLSYMGVKIDADANDGARSSETIISSPDSTVKVALIPTNEELVIARDTMHIVSELDN